MPTTRNSRIKVAVIGAGFGKEHARIYTSFPDVEVVGIAGRNPEKTMEAAQALGVPGYTDPMALIERPDIDAIDVCTPTPAHARYVNEALKHGKDVFCETPVAYTLKEAEGMAQAAAANDRKLLVALFGRFQSEYRYVRELISAGRLGKVKAVFANRRTAPIWGSWDENFILNLMLHDIDYIYWLLGKPFTVTSQGLENPGGGWNHVTVLLDYAGGGATIEGSGIMPLSFPFSTCLRVVGEAGAFDLNWHWAGSAPASEVRFYPQKGEPESLSIPGYDPYEAECRYFIDCVLGKADPDLLSIASACGSLAIAAAAKVSLEQQGSKISI
jgi:UDP-N-acetylglucosamine 3-dehydrogenase